MQDTPKFLKGPGSEPEIFWFHLFSHSTTLQLSHRHTEIYPNLEFLVLKSGNPDRHLARSFSRWRCSRIRWMSQRFRRLSSWGRFDEFTIYNLTNLQTNRKKCQSQVCKYCSWWLFREI
jgi:hypothetical protein